MIYIFIALFSYALTVVLDAWMDENMILHGYYKFIHRISNAIDDSDGKIVYAKWYGYPLGLCSKCMNVWLTIIIILISLLFVEVQPIFIIPTIIASNYLIIKF